MKVESKLNFPGVGRGGSDADPKTDLVCPISATAGSMRSFKWADTESNGHGFYFYCVPVPETRLHTARIVQAQVPSTQRFASSGAPPSRHPVPSAGSSLLFCVPSHASVWRSGELQGWMHALWA